MLKCKVVAVVTYLYLISRNVERLFKKICKCILHFVFYMT